MYISLSSVTYGERFIIKDNEDQQNIYIKIDKSSPHLNTSISMEDGVTPILHLETGKIIVRRDDTIVFIQ